MSVIRIAREKKPKTQSRTRPFTEREKELNKMSRRHMLKEWRMKFDPYKMKGIKTFPDGTDNPFYYMSLYRIQNFIKTYEKSENPPFKEENEAIATAIEFITVFKDLLHCTTSEAVAKTIEEAKGLVEEGFEYVCTHESIMIFRKRK